jgi:D-threo-aldose 1-dehydrogenase
VKYIEVKKTGLQIPEIIFGTSALGNLYQAIQEEVKLNIVKECLTHIDGHVVFDSAGKYGAGLALEKLGEKLREININPEKVIISNKLGWLRTELTTDEPTFEKGVWMKIDFDAVQTISYEGILKCWEQGNNLIGQPYTPQFVSVHDPDEYLASAGNDSSKRMILYKNILDAYKALHDLKKEGKVKAIGVGAKNWKVIQQIAQDIELDWVMLANSMTIYRHPKELLDFMNELYNNKITIINSAVFNAGFLTGGYYFDYKLVDTSHPEREKLNSWRNNFYDICKEFSVLPANACIHFGMSHPGVASIALNTSKPEHVKRNIDSVQSVVPMEFYDAMKNKGLIRFDYPYV